MKKKDGIEPLVYFIDSPFGKTRGKEKGDE